MKKLFFLLTLINVSLLCSGQSNYLNNYFESPDSSDVEFFEVTIQDSNVWHIGKPQKTVFDSAFTKPLAMVTDTINPYPSNAEGVFSFEISPSLFQDPYFQIIAIQWVQKLDIEKGKDIGIIEFSVDSGATWKNMFDHEYSYNLYGFDDQNIDTINGDIGFSGIDSTWKNVWLCHDVEALNFNCDDLVPESCGKKLQYRFIFKSDGNQSNQEGWIIDNLMIQPTFVHTLTSTGVVKESKVFPTITQNKVNIEVQRTQEVKMIEEILVYNITGELVQQHSNVPVKYFVRLENEPSGTYIVKVKTKKEIKSFQVILKK